MTQALTLLSSQFRKLLNDAVILLRDVASDAASKAASRAGPSEEQLRQMDDPAPDHEWRDAPNLSKDALTQQVREKLGKRKPIDHDDLREVVGDAAQAADRTAGSRDPRDLADRAAQDQQQGTQSGVDAVSGLRTGAAELTHRVEENVPEESSSRQRVREYRDRTQKYLKGKIPLERREQTIWRLKKMVVEIQAHRSYSEAIDTLITLAETYSGHGKAVAQQGARQAKDARQDNYLQSAEHNLKAIIERFADNTSADDLVDAINDIYRDADRDPELKNWFRSLNGYIRKCLQQQAYIMEPASTHEYDRLYDQGRFLLRNRYRDHTDRLMNEVQFMGDQFAADPDNDRFRGALQKLFADLGNDHNGKPVFKKHLVKDITQVVVPDLLSSLRYIPVPRIEYSDRAFDAVIENLVLESDNLMPNALEIDCNASFLFGRKTVTSKHHQEVVASASGIQCDLRDVSYYIKRKQGFPSITDQGVVDIFLGGEGFGFRLGLSTAEEHDRAQFFKVDTVKVFIKHLNIKFKQSRHKALFGIFKPLLLKAVKPVITKLLEQQIRQTFSDIDAFCYRVHQEEQRAEQQIRDNPDPENVQNVYSRYYKAFQQQVLARKQQQAGARTADKHARMAVTAEDSIFRDIELPGGISTRATEFRNQAHQGERWENDIFTIGSANPTNDVAQPAPVTRKSPHARRRAVRDREDAEASAAGQSRDSGYVGQENLAYGSAGSSAFGSTTTTAPFALNKASDETYERYTRAGAPDTSRYNTAATSNPVPYVGK